MSFITTPPPPPPPPPTSTNDIITAEEVAGRYSKNIATIRAWLRGGRLAGFHRAGRWYSTWTAVWAFEGRLPPAPGTPTERAQRPLLTTRDVARIYRLSPATGHRTVARWLRRGELPGLRILGEWYTDWPAVQEHLASQRRGG